MWNDYLRVAFDNEKTLYICYENNACQHAKKSIRENQRSDIDIITYPFLLEILQTFHFCKPSIFLQVQFSNHQKTFFILFTLM